MLSIKTLRVEYLLFKFQIKKELNLSNLTKITRHQIKSIDKKYDNELLTIYKRNLLSKYFKINNDETMNFIDKFNKLIYKLGITLTHDEEEQIEVLLNIDLTRRRLLKSVRHPFENIDEYGKQQCYFIYENVKLYKDKSRWLSLDGNFTIYFLSNSLILYDEKSKYIYKTIYWDKIIKIELKKYGVIIYAGITDSFVLNSISNKTLWISLIRTIKKYDSNHISLRDIENY